MVTTVNLFLTKELGLLSGSNLLSLVLDVLLNTTTSDGSLLSDTRSNKSVLGLELLGLIDGLVDYTETDSSTTTELRLQPINEGAGVILDLVHSAQLLADLLLRSADGTWVKNLDGELLTSKEWVAHELLSSDNEINHHLR